MTFDSQLPSRVIGHGLDDLLQHWLRFRLDGVFIEVEVDAIGHGALLFGLFLDRLRGKQRGVTAMIRYPLRLLTLQQGQRLLRLIVHAEKLRREERIGSWPFEIGFWVGSGNTPNRFKMVPVEVPEANDPDFPDDARLEDGVVGLSEDERRQALRYREFQAACNKVPECPLCGSSTGLRRFVSEGDTAKRLGIVCFNGSCAYGPADGMQHLPFLLTDDTIYARAPAVLLGTIDKMAMLGHHTTTIRQLMGMFGLARGVGPSGHLFSPRLENNLRTTLSDNDYRPVYPTFSDGERVYFDPFPSLIIQDEAHLLEESLGSLEPLSPYKNNYDSNRGVVARIDRCQCGSQEFRLNNSSPIFSEWSFSCENCGKPRDLKQGDRLTWEILERERSAGGRNFEFIEVNMLPVSYRANSAYYPQKISFIEFRDRSVVDLLLPERRDDLMLKMAEIHGFTYSAPTDEEIQEALAHIGKADDWSQYRETMDFAERQSARGQIAKSEKLRAEATALKESWYADGIIERGQVQSPELIAAVTDRGGWARRYDPIRLTIEHDRFLHEHIEERREKHEAIDVTNPDRLICDAVGNPAELAKYQREIGTLLGNIGIQNLMLIRGLPICESSFGFSRVSSTPVYVREYNGRSIDMPVKLNAFPAAPSSKHPIYVTMQRNEALYFSVDQDRVRRWLAANGISDVPEDKSLGASYLERYSDFRPYLDEFKQREGRGNATRDMCSYVYLLLHSLAHQAMHSLADVSGLDRDALGEYIFPADFAFVIYRKGMTPDLGNVSAMWRNHGADFLRRMLDQRLLRCGSGSLCDTRGGACPACIMVSEVTCLTANQLLSRASLRGGPAPNWEPREAPPLIGFYDPSIR